VSAHVAHDEQCPHCGRFANRGLSVDAAIVRDGAALLCLRRDDPFAGWWALLGGFVEWDETAEAALARELLEEASLQVAGARLLGVWSDPGRAPQHSVTLGYAVEAAGEPRPGDDLAELRWWPLGALPELAFDHGAILAAALAAGARKA
jgi:8-oxo-dGTP diphosphatase